MVDESSGSFPRAPETPAAGPVFAHVDRSGGITIDAKSVFLVIAILLGGGGMVGTAGGWIGGKIPDDVRADIAAAKASSQKTEHLMNDIARDVAIIKEDRERVQKVADDHESRIRKLEEKARTTR